MPLATLTTAHPAHFGATRPAAEPIRPFSPSSTADTLHFGQANPPSRNARKRPSRLNWMVLLAFLLTGGGMLARPAVDQALSAITRPADTTHHDSGSGHADAGGDSHRTGGSHDSEEAESGEETHGNGGSEETGGSDTHETPAPSRADKRLAREIRQDLEDRMTIYNYLGIAEKIGHVRNDLLRAELILDYLDAAHGDHNNYSLFAVGVSEYFFDYSSRVGTLMQRYTTERDTDERADLRDEILDMVENGD